jgi:hypothetical protein
MAEKLTPLKVVDHWTDSDPQAESALEALAELVAAALGLAEKTDPFADHPVSAVTMARAVARFRWAVTNYREWEPPEDNPPRDGTAVGFAKDEEGGSW